MASKNLDMWIRALKPPIYATVSVPIVVGSAVAYADGYSVDLGLCLKLFLGCIFLLTWCNISNDVFDATTGVDKDKEESYVRVTGTWWGCLLASKLCLLVSCLIFRLVLRDISDPRITYLLATSTALAYVYQGPPFRLSYKGLGEVLCFFAFGPVGTPVFYFAQVPGAKYSTALIVCSMLVGLSTSSILLSSHFHQAEQDFAHGKMSPIVRLGTYRASRILIGIVCGMYLAVTILAFAGLLPRLSPIFVFASAPVAQKFVQLARYHYDEPEIIRPLKVSASKWHLAFHTTLTMGLLSAAR